MNATTGGSKVARPLHVAHAVLSMDLGGLERVVVDLVRYCVRRGGRASVICLEREGGLAGLAGEAGATVHCLHKPSGRRPEVREKAGRLFASLCPDVVHTHQIGPMWYLGPAARSRGIPMIHTEHGNPFARASGVLARVRLRLLYCRASRWLDRFCCVSPALVGVMKRYYSVPEHLLDVIPNGICTDLPEGIESRGEVRARWGIPQGAMVIGTVARLDEVKRQDLLIGAFSRVVDKHPDCHLLLVGDGPERGKLEAQARELGLLGKVHFTGFQSQPEAYYRAMDVFALTSRSEGLPVSLLEAWNAGLPVVCTAVGGLRELVVDEWNGRLVQPGNVYAIAAALRWCVRGSTIVRRMGLRGRATVLENYSVDRMVDAYWRRYEHAIGLGVI